jgi:ribosomal protein S18 acetylase RimI-like enzyme
VASEVQPVTSFEPLDAALAERVCTWAESVAEVALFAGTSLLWPFSAAQLLAVAAQQQRQVVVLALDDLPLACGSLQRLPDSARIGWVLVDPKRRGQGWGRVLVTHLVQLARDTGAERITLGVYQDNLPARSLYADLGFVDTGNRRVSQVDGQAWISLDFELLL